MPELRRKPDGRHFIDYTLDGKRKRVAVEPPAGGSKDFVRDPEYAREFYDVWLTHKWPELQQEGQGRAASGKLDTVQELVAWYLDDYLVGRNRDSSVRVKRCALERFRDFCKERGASGLGALTPALVEAYRSDCMKRGMAAQTTRAWLGYLASAVHAAEALGLIDPVNTRAWPKQAAPRPKRVVLTPEEVGRFVAKAQEDEEYGNALTWLALTGMRISDVVGLLWTDVQGDTLNRIQQKTGKPLVRGLAGPLSDVLASQRRKGLRGLHVFSTPKGRPLPLRTLFDRVAAVAAEAGLSGVNPRTFRHTLATNLARKRVAWNVISQLLGHANPVETFRTYQHLSLTDADEAAEGFESEVLGRRAPIKAPTGTGAVIPFDSQRVTKR
jgi:integrase